MSRIRRSSIADSSASPESARRPPCRSPATLPRRSGWEAPLASASGRPTGRTKLFPCSECTRSLFVSTPSTNSGRWLPQTPAAAAPPSQQTEEAPHSLKRRLVGAGTRAGRRSPAGRAACRERANHSGKAPSSASSAPCVESSPLDRCR